MTIANHLADFFAESSATAGYPESFLANKDHHETNELNLETAEDSILNQDFTIHELFQALDHATGTSEGPDQIGYPMLKRLHFYYKKKNVVSIQSNLAQRGRSQKMEGKHHNTYPKRSRAAKS